MQRFYGRVRAPETERAMLESLGIEVAPLRAEDGESFYVAMGEAARARLAELAADFPHGLHARSRDLDGPLAVVVMTPAERAGEAAWLDFLEAHPALRRPAWFSLQRDALAGKQGAYCTPREQVQAVLAAHGESADLSHMLHYASLDHLAETVRGSRHWGQGEIFVCAIDDARFVILKQIAPSSCEMLTLTHHGFHDVLTAYRYEQQALVETLRDYLQVDPEPAPRYEQPPGYEMGGFVVGHAAKMNGNPATATIVALETRDGRPLVTVQYPTPQRVDAPEGATSTRFETDWRSISATWRPAPRERVLPVLPTFRDDVLLRQGTTVELHDPIADVLRTGVVADDYTVADRTGGRTLTMQPVAAHTPRVSFTEDDLRRIVTPAPDSENFVRRPAHTYRVAMLSVSPEGERAPLGVVFAHGASAGDAEVRAYDRLWTPALRAARCQPAYQTEAVPRYVHGGWGHLFADAGGTERDCRLVFDRNTYALTALQVRHGAKGWGPATEAERASVEDSLVHANPEALFGPAQWGLSESDTPPAWTREPAAAPRMAAADLAP
ncbi:hypothetical protein [Cupriavidus sp. TMH.W2]|uniref:hypothetical protein n=1 Tax=Cupriavidus sp. TMH.W2 TaxID=3434465 RepID=UPI003D77E723